MYVSVILLILSKFALKSPLTGTKQLYATIHRAALFLSFLLDLSHLPYTIRHPYPEN